MVESGILKRSSIPIGIERKSLATRAGLAWMRSKERFQPEHLRYVSTVQAEEEIDLAAVHTDLLVVEKQIGAAKERYNQYLAELGLPLLP